MTKYNHSALFGFLCAASFCVIVAGLLLWFAQTFVPMIEWGRLWSAFLSLPAGPMIMILGFFGLVTFCIIGNITEPRR